MVAILPGNEAVVLEDMVRKKLLRVVGVRKVAVRRVDVKKDIRMKLEGALRPVAGVIYTLACRVHGVVESRSKAPV